MEKIENIRRKIFLNGISHRRERLSFSLNDKPRKLHHKRLQSNVPFLMLLFICLFLVNITSGDTVSKRFEIGLKSNTISNVNKMNERLDTSRENGKKILMIQYLY